MKKTYTKPQVHVESFAMDCPIAANCNADFDDVKSMMEFGYFMPGENCSINLLPNGGFDLNDDGEADSHDTVCYHSNVQIAFTS